MDWKATLADAMAERRRELGERPSTEELIALRAGELSDDERERLIEHAAWDPDVARELFDLLRFPALPDGEAEVSAAGPAQDRSWQALRARLRSEGVLPESAAPPDFDTRPGGMDAGTPDMWVAECPHCSYCSEDLSSAAPGTAELVRGAEYRELLDNRNFPPIARPFICYSYLVEKSHYWADAGWICIHAAWACDDAGDIEAARDCRPSLRRAHCVDPGRRL